MRVSLCVDPGRSWPEVLALARRADAAGWHAVYVCDHFMPHDQAGRSVDGPMLECWTVLAALAAQTTAVGLGSLVLGNTYRHPAVVANMAASLDRVSGGRLVLGVGAGWQPNEHAAYGIALPPGRERVAALDEACAVIRSLLDQRRSTINGAAYRLVDAPCDPKPASRVPLLVGGAGRGIMTLAARRADVWHAWAGPADLAAKNAVLDGLCRAIGRRPGDLARASGAAVTVRSGPAGEHGTGEHGTGEHGTGEHGTGEHEAGKHEASEHDVRGTPRQVLSQLREFADAGADEFIVRDDAKVPPGQALAQIDILTNAVLPELARSGSTAPSSRRCRTS